MAGAGDWLQFKRDLAHTGLNAQERGALSADTLAVRWSTQVADPGSRAASGPVIAMINGRPTVFVAVCEGGNGCFADVPGRVVALDGLTGDVIWSTRLPGTAQTDPYAPLLADVDGDGNLELVVTTNNTNQVFALRTVDEPGGRAGSIQWTFTFDRGWTSEAAPTAARLDPTRHGLAVIFGTSSNGQAAGAKVYAVDGATGRAMGAPFVSRRRRLADARCSEIDKIDSSAPAVATVGGRPTIYVGAWDGYFYAIDWLTSPNSGLYARWQSALPRYTGGPQDCSIRKVRDGAAIGRLLAGGPLDVVFGYMAEPRYDRDYPTARLRVLNANGLGLIADAPITDWKSSPSLGALLSGTPGLDIAGGRYQGVYAARLTTAGKLVTIWDHAIGDGNGGFGGNRSSPAIADINGDGTLDVLIGIEGQQDPGLNAYDGATGALLWHLPLPAPGVDGSPAVGDIDGDGQLEVVFFAIDGKVYALDQKSSVP
jgi:outer membrane protein assembly factor BamB